jgi:DNA-binding FadR family transcriptional regulator
LQFGVDVTKQGMMDAWNELRPMVNLVPYYTEDWGPVLSRHGAMMAAIDAGKVKDARGLMIQVVAAYKKVMKIGKWRPGAWGKTEPK